MIDSSSNGRDSPPPRSHSRLRRIALAMILGVAVAIFGVVLVLAIVMRRDQLPEVTFENLNAAAARWSDAGPADYDMDLQLSGVNPGQVHVEVRAGQVTAMTLNGRPTREHLWDDWSVPGLFSVIRRDLEVCMAAPDQLPPGATVVYPRGLFDQRLGYPIAYHRVTPTGADARWRVTRFTRDDDH